MSKMNFESQSFEIESRISDDEVKNILKKFNNPRLSANDLEYFVIDMGETKRYVPKRTYIPEVGEDGATKRIRIDEFLKRCLDEAEKNNLTV